MKKKYRMLLFVVIGFAILGILQFLICTGVAMVRFPGGYSFRENFLSELGFMGHDGHALFNGSLMFMGAALLPTFVLLWLLAAEESFSMRATSVFGIISSLGVMGVGFWTHDRYFFAHTGCMILWLLPMLYMAVTFFYAASRSPYVGIGFLGVSLVMVVGMIYVLTATRTTSVQLLQKTVVICGLIWLGFVVAFIWQAGLAAINRLAEDDGSRARKEQSYLSTLTAGKHRRD